MLGLGVEGGIEVGLVEGREDGVGGTEAGYVAAGSEDYIRGVGVLVGEGGRDGCMDAWTDVCEW